MVNYTDIENTLKDLDSTYSTFMSHPSLPELLSKTALIELCGWIEDSIDQILYDYLGSRLSNLDLVKNIKDQIKRNHGFKYESVLGMLSMAIGARDLEILLSKIQFPILEGHLNAYSSKRNKAAHTHIVGTTPTYDAPSKILQDFKSIMSVITVIEREIGSLP
ncbi:hypothetical protein [Porphyromonas endodontalis]